MTELREHEEKSYLLKLDHGAEVAIKTKTGIAPTLQIFVGPDSVFATELSFADVEVLERALCTAGLFALRVENDQKEAARRASQEVR